MYILLLVIHVFVCLVLISVVLLQAGRGGGMSDMFGGGQPSTLFGTQTNEFMTRATEVCAVLFIITSLSLGILSANRGKSIMQRRSVAGAVKSVLPPTETPAVPAATAATAQTADVPAPVIAGGSTPESPTATAPASAATSTNPETAPATA